MLRYCDAKADTDDARRWLEELVEELRRRLREDDEGPGGGGEVEEETFH